MTYSLLFAAILAGIVVLWTALKRRGRWSELGSRFPGVKASVETPGVSVLWVDFSVVPSHVRSELFRELENLGRTKIELHVANADDGLFRGLSGLSIESLDISNTQVTDRGLAMLTRPDHLESLDASGSRLGDTAARWLGQRAKQLISLDLSRTTITDRGVESLVLCSELVDLDLSETGVTDKAVLSLLQIPKLAYVDVTGTGVGADGIRELTLRGIRVAESS